MKWQHQPHIEITRLICTAVQLSGIYMRVTLVFNELKKNFSWGKFKRPVTKF